MSIHKNESIHRFSHHAMSTVFEVVIAGMNRDYAGQASQAVFHDIDRLEGLLSRFNPSSEIGRINRLSPGEELSVGIELLECLQISEEIYDQTNGAFDINVKARIKRNEGAKSTEDHELLSSNLFPLTIERSGMRFIIAYPPDNSRDIYGEVDIDLGGIGKGYALDKAFEILRDWSIEDGFIHAGTSTVLAAGSPPDFKSDELGWPVGVATGWEKTTSVNKVILKDRALSGSGKEIKGEHIIDPFTGRPAKGHAAAWVSHPVAAEADALSTAFIVMDTEAVKEYCRNHPEVWALLVQEKGTITVLNQELLMVD